MVGVQCSTTFAIVSFADRSHEIIIWAFSSVKFEQLMLNPSGMNIIDWEDYKSNVYI